MIGSYENGKPSLYLIDPSGSYNEYRARSIGNASQVVNNEVQNRLNTCMNNEQDIESSLRILKEVMKEKMTCMNLEIMMVDKEGAKFMAGDEIDSYVSQI